MLTADIECLGTGLVAILDDQIAECQSESSVTNLPFRGRALLGRFDFVATHGVAAYAILLTGLN
jgi:hypothetical protein